MTQKWRIRLIFEWSWSKKAVDAGHKGYSLFLGLKEKKSNRQRFGSKILFLELLW